MFKRGLPFPCINTGSMPSFDSFVDCKYLDQLTREDYDHVYNAYNYMGCSDLEHYAVKHLEGNTYGLASVLSTYAKFSMFVMEGLSPLWDCSISSYAYACMHFISRTKYENVRDSRLVKIIEGSLLPGISISNVRRQDFCSKRLGDDCDEHESIECMHLDYKSQYSTIMSKEMPVGSYQLWTKEEVSSFSLNLHTEEGDTRYIICCSLKYPENLHCDHSELPLGYSRASNIQHDATHLQNHMHLLDETATTSRIDLSLHDKTDIWISLKLLNFYLSMGLILQSISGVISYKVSRHLAKFANLCLESRFKHQNCPFRARIFKALPNYALGKTSQKRDNLRVSLPSSERAAKRLLSKSLFYDCFPVAESIAIVYMRRKKGLPAKNVFRAFHVQSESVFLLYELYYKHIRGIWGNSAKFLYGQTDSGIFAIHGSKDYYGDLAKLSNILDFSSVPQNVPLYDASHKPLLMRWKFESFFVKQFLSLRQKSYSILEVNKDCLHENYDECNLCTKCKGIRKKQCTHQQYLDVLNRKHPGFFTYKHLHSDISGTIAVQEAS